MIMHRGRAGKRGAAIAAPRRRVTDGELRPSRRRVAAAPTVLTGTVVAWSEASGARVTFEGVAAAVPARSTTTLGPADVGAQVVLVFDHGDPGDPIVIGRVVPVAGRPRTDPVEVIADGERLAVVARESIVLRCGKASITLTRAGKVILRGAYVLSRSSGVNCIKGGSVQIN
jgi:uncharacterized protein DUF6484